LARSILVTGGAGYIGAHVAKALAGAGFVPVSLDSLVRGHREFVRWGPLVTGNVGDEALLAQTFADFHIEAVIHLAGFAYVGESVQDPIKYFRNNTANGLILLDAMRKARVGTIVFSSTCAVYGNPLTARLVEDHPTAPVNPYGESKLMLERALDSAGRIQGLRWMALRYFNAAGADPDGEIGEDHWPEPHLIPRACLAALGAVPPVEIYGTDYPTSDGTAVRDYVHVCDLAQAHVAALSYLLAGGASRAVNLGVGRGHSVKEVIAAVGRISGTTVPTIVAARRAGDPAALVADPAAAERLLGWQARAVTLDTMIESAWRWHARQQHPVGDTIAAAEFAAFGLRRGRGSL
jgi:UDP-arabinose 4-epimerase